jgi:hypothetical protein
MTTSEFRVIINDSCSLQLVRIYYVTIEFVECWLVRPMARVQRAVKHI